MQTSQATVAGLATVILLISGCRGGAPQPGPSDTASPAASVYYTGQTLPVQVDRLSGTPLYSTSTELAARVKLDGAPFLLIAPQEPSQALLVVEAGTTSADLAARASELADFSGSTETVDAPELIAFVKETVGLDLKTDESGKVVVLKVPRGNSSAVPRASSPSTAPSAAAPGAAGATTGAVATPSGGATSSSAATPPGAGESGAPITPEASPHGSGVSGDNP